MYQTATLLLLTESHNILFWKTICHWCMLLDLNDTASFQLPTPYKSKQLILYWRDVSYILITHFWTKKSKKSVRWGKQNTDWESTQEPVSRQGAAQSKLIHASYFCLLIYLDSGLPEYLYLCLNKEVHMLAALSFSRYATPLLYMHTDVLEYFYFSRVSLIFLFFCKHPQSSISKSGKRWASIIELLPVLLDWIIGW